MRNIKPTHKPVKTFYAELKQYESLGATNETEVRLAFATLFQHYARQNNLTLICEKSLRTPQSTTIYVDGMLTDNVFGLPRGYWEAKDLHDNLATAVRQKFDVGYPQDNILFTTQERVLLYQDGQAVMDVGIADVEAFAYRLGNRSALEWVVDQYRVKTDKRSSIVNDPNRADDETYIVDLIRKVIGVSLETVRIVEGLSGLDIGAEV